MHCEFYTLGNKGPELVMRAPLASAQPVNGDSIAIEVEDGTVVFSVYNREFMFTQNPDGGGVTVVLRLHVTKTGSIPKAEEDEEIEEIRSETSPDPVRP